MSTLEGSASLSGSEFVMTRAIAAPRQRVWAAFSDAETMRHWWGPKGIPVVSAAMELRPGGAFHYALRAPDGSVFWGMFVYLDIVEPECLVFENFFSDERGGIRRHPWSATWPLKTLSAIEFAELGVASQLTIRWSTIDANVEEQATFDHAHEAMREGWSGTLDQLEAYLAKA